MKRARAVLAQSSYDRAVAAALSERHERVRTTNHLAESAFASMKARKRKT